MQTNIRAGTPQQLKLITADPLSSRQSTRLIPVFLICELNEMCFELLANSFLCFGFCGLDWTCFELPANSFLCFDFCGLHSCSKFPKNFSCVDSIFLYVFLRILSWESIYSSRQDCVLNVSSSQKTYSSILVLTLSCE